MNQNIQRTITSIMEQVYNHYQGKMKFDTHYETGKGVLIVPYGYSLEPQNVIVSVSEQQLLIMSMTGVNINFN